MEKKKFRRADDAFFWEDLDCSGLFAGLWLFIERDPRRHRCRCPSPTPPARQLKQPQTKLRWWHFLRTSAPSSVPPRTETSVQCGASCDAIRRTSTRRAPAIRHCILPLTTPNWKLCSFWFLLEQRSMRKTTKAKRRWTMQRSGSSVPTERWSSKSWSRTEAKEDGTYGEGHTSEIAP